MAVTPAHTIEPHDLHVTTSTERATTVVTVFGDLDASSAPQLFTELWKHQAAQSAALVLDLSAVSFCSSTGLHAYEDLLAHQQRSGVTVAVAIGTGAAHRIFALLGYDTAPGVTTTRAAALDTATRGGLSGAAR